ncbi:hypothetical protein F2Q69_00037550 [Brassica cretica]|uniref:Uncharacterized protein n=1 Tax=Brassica cretica TaxID=69181 RepID=A0A8S9SH56_BRACR|nr:hypothetical protein F2Q69_00037550 [Brassica cretica]
MTAPKLTDLSPLVGTVKERKKGSWVAEGSGEELHVAVVVDAESSSKQQEALNSELPMNEIADLVVILDVDEERSTGTGVRKEIEKSLEDQNKL